MAPVTHPIHGKLEQGQTTSIADPTLSRVFSSNPFRHLSKISWSLHYNTWSGEDLTLSKQRLTYPNTMKFHCRSNPWLIDTAVLHNFIIDSNSLEYKRLWWLVWSRHGSGAFEPAEEVRNSRAEIHNGLIMPPSLLFPSHIGSPVQSKIMSLCTESPELKPVVTASVRVNPHEDPLKHCLPSHWPRRFFEWRFEKGWCTSTRLLFTQWPRCKEWRIFYNLTRVNAC